MMTLEVKKQTKLGGIEVYVPKTTKEKFMRFIMEVIIVWAMYMMKLKLNQSYMN